MVSESQKSYTIYIPLPAYPVGPKAHTCGKNLNRSGGIGSKVDDL